MSAQQDYPDEEMLGDDVIVVLKAQHERVKTLFGAVAGAEGDRRQEAFDDLRRLLAVHETAEELVLRPVSKSLVPEIADARNAEEKEANEVLSQLESMDVNSAEFDTLFAEFETAVLHHAQNEESQEFPRILTEKNAEERAQMGRNLKKVESLAPTHPHPTTAGSTTAQLMVGPFASMVDRVKDALSGG